MHSSHIFQQPISYRYDLYLAETSKPLIISTHGYGQNKLMAMEFANNIRQDWSIAALQAPHPHHIHRDGGFEAGFSWVSSYEPQEDVENHHHFIDQVIAHAGRERSPSANILFGFSQSVSLNFRYAAHKLTQETNSITAIIAVAGAVPSNWMLTEAARLKNLPVLYICPQEDEAYQHKMTEFKTLLSHHAQLTWLEFPGRHRIPSAAYQPIKVWLDEIIALMP
ncbi:MAG: hypothetical protein R2880_09650 [Deinococcales bacterium]